MQKHAYLIMAHSDWSLLSKLLYTLDDKRNDIYLHVDKKATFQLDDIYHPTQSGFVLVPRTAVSWGGTRRLNVS